ncbi:MAG: hypothetical protein ACOX6P_08910 [Candidatus Merdivicinus sp.]|jgi:hypothetical protein
MKRVFCMLLTIWIGVSVLFGTEYPAAAAETSSRMIDVVYDDSGSMYQYQIYQADGSYSHTEYYDKWCRARYAMEVFAAMMEEQDTMNIFPISKRGTQSMSVSGSEDPQTRIDRIHKMKDGASGTYYETVTAAYDHLMTAGENAEKWLIILTDGDFEGAEGQDWKPASELNSDFSKFASSGVQIVYLAIGEEIRELPTSDPDAGIVARQAADSTEILSSVTDICNLIYQRQQLPESCITYAGNTLTIDFDVPMEQIFLFSQGANVSLSGEDSSVLQRKSDGNVRYSEEIPARYADSRDKIPVARDLTGTLAEFSSADSNQPIPAGTYTFSLTGASSVQVYYKHAAEIGIHLSQNGKEIQQAEALIPAPYTVSLVWQHPVSGEAIESEILAPASFSGTIRNGSNEQEWQGNLYEGTAEPGTLEITANASFPDGTVLTSQFSAEVSQPAGSLWIEGIPAYTDPIPFGGLDGDNGEDPFQIRYQFFKEDPVTGEKIPLSAAELETLQLSVELFKSERPGSLPLKTERNTEGNWVTDPDYTADADGKPDPMESLWGDITLLVTGTYTAEDGQQGSGSTEISFRLDPPPWYIRYFWPIFWLLLLLIVAILFYFAFIRPAKFVRGKHGISPAMSATKKPDSLRPQKESDPLETSGILYGPKWVPFHNQKAIIRAGCYGETHLHFTVEAVRAPRGSRAMRLIGLKEQLEDPRFSHVTVNGRELPQVNFTKAYGYHLQIHYRIGTGKRATDFDFKL